MQKSQSSSKLLIVGSVAYDSIKTPFGKVDKTLGGSASYFSLAAGHFTRPSLIAVVGDDFQASDRKILTAHNVDISGLQKQTGKTFAWGGEYNFDMNTRKTLFTHLNVFEFFNPLLSENNKNSLFVFLGNIHPKLQQNVLKQVKRPILVGLDTMNYWIEKTPSELQKVLKLVDVIVINESEARQLAKQYNLKTAAKKILATMGGSTAKTLIVKQGEYGLLMFQGSKIFNLPGYPLESVADPTGAGDAFAGGLMGYLSTAADVSWSNLKRACVAGSTLASFCVEKLGTKRLLEISNNDINKRIREFKLLTHFEA